MHILQGFFFLPCYFNLMFLKVDSLSLKKIKDVKKSTWHLFLLLSPCFIIFMSQKLSIVLLLIKE